MIEFETELPFMVAVFYPMVLILVVLLVSPVGVEAL
jgi:hypothetical protein